MAKRWYLVLFFILVSTIFTLKAFAQVQSTDILLTINPVSPKSGEGVLATVSTHSTDLNKANISWSLNGKVAFAGVGKKDFSFAMGDIGTTTNLEVDIETSSGSFVNKQITLTPANMDLIWEAVNSYVPPFYKGKALATSQGIIKVVALSPNSGSGEIYSYKWKQDGTNLPDSSGYGKNYYVFQNSYLEPDNTIETVASNLIGNTVGASKITINYGKPIIDFYQKDSTLGTKWEHALVDGFTVNKDGETLIAEPYFFSPKDLSSSNLDFKWTLNGDQIETPSQKNELSIKPEAGTSGNTAIKIAINNVNTLFLSLEKTLNVNF